jgi:hypothetical protein
MKKLKRVQIEEALLDNECNTISQMVINNDLSYVHDIFYSGFKGYAHFTDEELVAEYKEQLGEEVELIKPFAISISDGHEEDWQYFEDKESCLETFEKMKGFYDDIHVYEYIMEMEQYEVFLSFWIEDVENAADEDTSFEFEQYAQLTYVNDDENVRLFIDGRFVGRMYVWKDGEMEDREYLTINHEIVYLDTITQIFKLVTY